MFRLKIFINFIMIYLSGLMFLTLPPFLTCNDSNSFSPFIQFSSLIKSLNIQYSTSFIENDTLVGI